MKRRVGIVFLFVWMAGLGGIEACAADNAVVAPLRQQWESIRNMMVRIVEVVPEDKYNYKPTPDVRSFLDLFIHVAGENYFFMSGVTGDKPGDLSRLDKLKTREEILKALHESYDYGAKILAGLDDQKAMEIITVRNRQMPRWQPALANIVDNMDHYGNLVVYMRLNGIVPPESAPRQPQR